jgi:hypothetical protein
MHKRGTFSQCGMAYIDEALPCVDLPRPYFTSSLRCHVLAILCKGTESPRPVDAEAQKSQQIESIVLQIRRKEYQQNELH